MAKNKNRTDDMDLSDISDDTGGMGLDQDMGLDPDEPVARQVQRDQSREPRAH